MFRPMFSGALRCYPPRMTSTDRDLAKMFAQEFRNRFAWRKQPHVQHECCWYWKPTSNLAWRELSDDQIPREELKKFAVLDGLEVTPEQLTEGGLTRILELAKEPLQDDNFGSAGFRRGLWF